MNARDVVTSHIAEQARRFPDWINRPLDLAALEARDAALATAIDHAVMRRWLTLVAVIESRLSRPWAEIEFRMQAVLLVGAAQLLLMDRLPDHAVINEAVEWAKRNVRPKAGGMVNAVLRKVAGLRMEMLAKPQAAADVRSTGLSRDELPLGDGRVWKLNEPVFAEAPIVRLAQQTSHPESLLAHWLSIFGQETMTRIAHHDLVQAPIIVHGVDRDMSVATSGGEDAPTRALLPHDEDGFFVFEGDRASLSHWLRENPGAIVQDPTSAATVRATTGLHPPPKFIIDACAGMGTKTRHLAALHPDATIIATDVAEHRLDALHQQFADHDRVRVVDHRLLDEFQGQADLVLLDVPCSNTGVLARRVEAKYRFDRESLQSVVDVQRQIIADSLLLLSAAGRLLYSTCSIDPAENDRQAEWVCQWHPFVIEHKQTRLPTGVPGDPPSRYTDGGFFTILSRRPAA